MISPTDRSATDRVREPRSVLDISHSEKHYRRLLDMLPAGAYLCDADGLITYFNHHAVRLWGREPALNDSVDRFCGSFKLYRIDGTLINHDQCWMALALKEEREFRGEEIIVERPDGSRVIGLAHASPIHGDDGRLIGAVNVLVDITARKQAEEALKAADRAKNEFLAMLSHELRNPLAPMRNALGILRLTGTGAEEGRRALDVIDRQMDRMTHLVNDLLDLSRITEGRLELRKSNVELAEIIEAAVEISRPLIEECDHELLVVMPSEPVGVHGDSRRLTQVLSNVLNNATSYTPRGGRIELEAACRGGELVIVVRDNGIGIPADKLHGIFEMFAQADHAPDRSHEGLGVGLALTRRVIELHGGSIEASSEGRGMGSTFTIRMPALPRASEQTASTARKGGLDAANGAPHRIMVVDDNTDVVESMSMLLEIMNIDVRTAKSGAEAIELGEVYRPDIILMDIGMPGMDGLECARAIRGKPWGRSTNLIAVTGWGQQSDIQRSREAGFDDHIVKPMDPDALMRMLGG